MQIGAHTVASFHYRLTSDDGQEIDSSAGGDPLTYMHGTGSLISGLEKQLEGKEGGDKLQVRVAPEEGYGLRDDRLVQTVSRTDLPADVDLTVGMQFQAQSEEGVVVVTVSGIEGDQVKIDGNHPLAGVALNFDVEVVEVRAATDEEKEHGHAHGPGGHEH